MSEPKAILYNTQSEWAAKQSEVEAALNISAPDKWCDLLTVNNSDHSDHGKYIMLVHTTGPSKCDQLFDAPDLVDIDIDWMTED